LKLKLNEQSIPSIEYLYLQGFLNTSSVVVLWSELQIKAKAPDDTHDATVNVEPAV